MMYYKITKQQAQAIGRFRYSDYEEFDPFCNEQVDGTYLVSEAMYEMLKTRPEFNSVDFSTLPKINESEINTKPSEI